MPAERIPTPARPYAAHFSEPVRTPPGRARDTRKGYGRPSRAARWRHDARGREAKEETTPRPPRSAVTGRGAEARPSSVDGDPAPEGTKNPKRFATRIGCAPSLRPAFPLRSASSRLARGRAQAASSVHRPSGGTRGISIRARAQTKPVWTIEMTRGGKRLLSTASG